MAEYNPSKIIKDGNTYNFRDTTKIPLAGSDQISGSLIPSTDGTVNLGGSSYQWNNAYIKSLTINDRVVLAGNTLGRTTNDDEVIFAGGINPWNNANISLHGNNFSNIYTRGQVYIQPADNTAISRMRLSPNGTWTWEGQPVQTASDARLKQQINAIDDALLDAWEDVNLVQFKYNDAVKEKSDNARLHTGYVVQQIDKACQSHGVDVSAYGLYCHEEYPEETEEVEIEQADGTKVKEKKVIREASEHYSLRYTEVYAVECMYLRRCIARLTARIEELEKEKKGNSTK